MAKKTRKKATRSRSSKKKVRKPARSRKAVKVTEEGLAIGSVRPAGQAKYLGTGRRGTKYQAVIDQVKGLKPGQSFTLAPPKGVDVAALHSRLGVIFSRSVKSGEITIPSGYRLRKRTIVDSNEIEISISSK